MSNSREYFAVASDGTMIPADQIEVVHLNPIEATTLLDIPSSERVSFARSLSSGNLDEIMYDLQMKDIPESRSYTKEQLLAMEEEEERYLEDERPWRK